LPRAALCWALALPATASQPSRAHGAHGRRVATGHHVALMRAEAESRPPIVTGREFDIDDVNGAAGEARLADRNATDGVDADSGAIGSGATGASDAGERYKCLMPLWGPGIFACAEWDKETLYMWDDPWGNKRIYQVSDATCTLQCPHAWQSPSSAKMFCRDGTYRWEVGSAVEEILCKTSVGMASALVCAALACCCCCCCCAYSVHSRRHAEQIEHDSGIRAAAAEPPPPPVPAGSPSRDDGLTIHLPKPTVKNLANLGKQIGGKALEELKKH